MKLRTYKNCVEYTFTTTSKESLPSKTRVRVFDDHQIDIVRIMLTTSPDGYKVLRKYRDMYLIEQNLGLLPRSINIIKDIINFHTQEE
jgi:hypothetical protein